MNCHCCYCCCRTCLRLPEPSYPCKRSDEAGWLLLAIIVLVFLGAIVALHVLP